MPSTILEVLSRKLAMLFVCPGSHDLLLQLGSQGWHLFVRFLPMIAANKSMSDSPSSVQNLGQFVFSLLNVFLDTSGSNMDRHIVTCLLFNQKTLGLSMSLFSQIFDAGHSLLPEESDCPSQLLHAYFPTSR